MRILLITSEFFPYTAGGVGTFASELFKGLTKKGHEVRVIARTESLVHNNIKTDNRVKYLFSPKAPPKDVVYYLTRMIDISNIVKETKPDIIHDTTSFAVTFMPWLTRYAPTVVTIHGSPQIGLIRTMLGGEDRLRSILFGLSHRLPEMFIHKFTNSEIKLWVFVSKFTFYDTLAHTSEPTKRKMFKNHSRIIYNGIDIDTLKRILKEIDVVEEHSVIFIGRLMEYKGINFLVKAFKYVAKELNDAVLNIVGNGPVFVDAKRMVERFGLEKNVRFYGYLPRNKVMKILARSKILTHPSLYESFGIIIAEAYAMGKPVITHRAGYAYELVAKTGSGIMVNVLNEKKYADAIVHLLTDESLYHKLSQRAWKTSKMFSIEAMVRKYIDAYRDALK